MRTVTPNAAAAILSVVLLATGCTPAGSSNPTRPTSTPTTARPEPVRPTVSAVSPDLGTTSGGTPVVISGSGFQAGLSVTFDTVTVPARFDTRYTDRVFIDTPPHAAGTVDVVLTNPGSEPGRLAAGYRYGLPDSFDFNGTWTGYPADGSDLPLAFTVRNDRLVSVTCDTTTIDLADAVPITNGEFSFTQSGAAMTGRIVSMSQAAGTIDVAPCRAPLWQADRAR